MRVCNCGHIMIGLFAVAQKEWACFKCGRTYEFFNDCERAEETKENEKIYSEVEKLKSKFYDEYPFEGKPGYECTVSLTPEQFKEWVSKNDD